MLPNPQQVSEEDLPSSWRFSFLLRIHYYHGACWKAYATQSSGAYTLSYLDAFRNATVVARKLRLQLSHLNERKYQTLRKGVLHAERIDF